MTSHPTLRSSLAIAAILFAPVAWSFEVPWNRDEGGYSWPLTTSPEENLGVTWTGVAQSFTAVDASITFAFKAIVVWNEAVTEDIHFALYAGDHETGAAPLLQASRQVAGTPFQELDLRFDLSQISLTTGERYTAVLTSNFKPLRDPFGSEPLVINYNEADVYTGGSGRLYGYSLPWSPTMQFDFAFSAAPVPEPATWLMILTGLGGLVAASRQRQARG